MTIWGTSAAFVNGLTGLQEWERIDGLVRGLNGGYGHKARRSYDAGMPTTINGTYAAQDVGEGRVSVFSLRGAVGDTGWNKTINGGDDAAIRSFCNSVPSGHKMYLIYNHEPENDGGNPQTLWRQAFARFAKVVLDVGNSNITPAFNLMAYTFNTSSRNPYDYNPGRHMNASEIAATVGLLDGYGDDTPYSRTPEATFGDCYQQIVNDWGFRGMGVAECGVFNVNGRKDWMIALEDFATSRSKVEVICWWHAADPGASYFLDAPINNDPTSFQEWADILSRNQGGTPPPNEEEPDVELPPGGGGGGGGGTGSGVSPGVSAVTRFPVFGEPTFVNIDDDPTENVLDEPGSLYWSDWSSWQLPAAIYEVGSRFVSVWFNTRWEADHTMHLVGQCRYVAPTSPPTLSAVETFFDDFSHDRSATNDDGYVSMTDQQTMSHCVIGDVLYIAFGYEVKQWYPGLSNYQTGYWGRIEKIDCSGDVPVHVGTWIQNGGTFTGGGSHNRLDATTYNIANVGGYIVAIPQYDDTFPPITTAYVLDQDLNDLWSDDEWGVQFDGGVPDTHQWSEVQFVACSDTNTSWLIDWQDRFSSFTADENGIVAGSDLRVELTDDSVDGVTVQGGQIDQEIFLATVNMYPRYRSNLHSNAAILCNYGFLAWRVWYDAGFQYDTSWMFDFSGDGEPTTYDGYGYHYDNGSSYAFNDAIVGNELMFLPLWRTDEIPMDRVYLNTGWDDIPEEQLAVFQHEPIGLVTSWSQHITVVMNTSGQGIMQTRSAYPYDEYGSPYSSPPGAEAMGKIQVVPFTAGGVPNLDGELVERRQKFARPATDSTP